MIEDAQESAYNNAFEQTYRWVQFQRQHEPAFTLDHLKGILETELIHQGNDWDGRGALAHLKSEATVAAYEHAIAEWEAESEDHT